jgi:hypothetical protein
VDYSINPERTLLTVTFNEQERAILVDLRGDNEKDPEQKEARRRAFDCETTLYDVFEWLTANSDLDWVLPQETGALTDAPLLGIRYEDDDRTYVDEVWGYADYMVTNPLDDAIAAGEITFRSGW